MNKNIPAHILKYRHEHMIRQTKVSSEIRMRWNERVIGAKLHELGKQGADIYIKRWGSTRIGEEKLVQLAIMAELERKQDIALGFWEKAYEVSIRSAQGSTKRAEKKGMNKPTPIKILFLGSGTTPDASKRLQEEIRAIDNALRLAKYRDHFDIVQHWAVRATDLQECLLRHNPDIVHISAQGDSTGIFLLEDAKGNVRSFPPDVLGRLFRALKTRVRCVVLNACYSIQQANELALFIDCAIGMVRSISDETAIAFSIGFYRGLAYGNDIQTSFDMGISEIALHHNEVDELYKPRLVSNKRNLGDMRFINIVQ